MKKEKLNPHLPSRRRRKPGGVGGVVGVFEDKTPRISTEKKMGAEGKKGTTSSTTRDLREQHHEVKRPRNGGVE